MAERRQHPLEEGWYTDPYELHEARWLDDGKPTKLVRDAGVESFDEPPSESPIGQAVRLATAPGAPSSLRRADDAEAKDYSDAVWDTFPLPMFVTRPYAYGKTFIAMVVLSLALVAAIVLLLRTYW